MSEESEHAAIVDKEHLRLLEICYYIAGGSKVLFALLPLIYVAIGVFLVVLSPHIPHRGEDVPLAFVGGLMMVIGSLISLFLGIIGGLQIYIGRCLHRRKNRMLCFVVAAFSCLSMPWGTALGIFTFWVLGRESVGKLFNARETVEQAPNV